MSDKMMEVLLCFSGFYETLWSDELDRCENQQAEYLVGSECDEPYNLEEEEVRQVLERRGNYQAMQIAVCKAYVEGFENWLDNAFALNVSLKFKDMTSPKFYNYETDRIFVEVSLSDIKKLLKEAGWKEVAEMAKKHFTSRSGFISWYNPDITTWGKVSTWDHNQLSMIFYALTRDTEYQMDIYYGLNESIYNAYNNNVDWDNVHLDLRDLVLDQEEGLCDIVIPRGVTQTLDYVKKFNELNHFVGA